MPTFNLVCNSADMGCLRHHPHAEYFASKAFRDRVKFEGARGEQDMLNITEYLLKELALRDDSMLKGLKRGIIIPNYFGISNPIPEITRIVLAPESDVGVRIRNLVKSNWATRAKAVQAVLRWSGRTPTVTNAISRACALELETTVPKRTNFWGSEDSEVIERRAELSKSICARYDKLADEAVARRHSRIRLLANAAYGEFANMSYHDILAKIAVKCLMP